ncbi:MAG: hypothetical protein H7Y88_08390 [Phycisphaerales bacterium]|nr:hypothetical protein [Phycisphaerales bacterium]
MDTTELRRQKQEKLLDLASIYKGLTRKQLADALGRDQTRLFPPSGNPKLDYLIRLSDVLDWQVGDVAEAIWARDEARGPEAACKDFELLDDQAKTAHREGRFQDMLRIAERMYLIGATADQRALACHRESGAWDGLGRYLKQLDAVRRGLSEGPGGADLRLLLRVNLANSYYTLWQPLEARALAKDLIEHFLDEKPTTRSARAAEAFSYYVLGHSERRLMALEIDRAPVHARHARRALERSEALYSALADEFNHDPWRGIASTCRGGLIEIAVELGELDASSAVAQLADGLDSVDSDAGEPGAAPAAAALVGDRLESMGWWCIFGCNIALRKLTGKELQRHMAVFTNKGYEIADRLDNWAMRERLFTLEYLQRERLNELAGIDVGWTIDSEEVRVIVGTMGRFPGFRSTGWRILETATVVGEN